MFNELPPILKGSTPAQLNAIRDYLVRMAQALQHIEYQTSGVSPSAIVNSKGGAVSSNDAAAQKTVEEVRANAAQLRALIIKTANEVKQYADSKTEEYNSLYVAQSEFGTFTEQINTQITATARGVVDSYNFQESIQTAEDNIGNLQTYLTSINGEIRRGIIEDPDNPGTYVTGIAVSQNLQFTGVESVQPDGYTYYELNSGQTFGLYTSTGWQFWIDGFKKGWFSSTDGMLHVANIVVENSLQIGSGWQIKINGDEFEITYLGE